MTEKNLPFLEEAEEAASEETILTDADPLVEATTTRAGAEANNKGTNSTKLKMFHTLR
jgi:hypothetical protein